MAQVHFELGEEFAQQLFDQSSDGLIVFDPVNLQILKANRAAAVITGRPSGALPGRRLDELFARTRTLQLLLNACRTPTRCHAIQLSPTSCSSLVSADVSPIGSPDGNRGLLKLRSRVHSPKNGNATNDKAAIPMNRQTADGPSLPADQSHADDWRLRDLVHDVNAILWEADVQTWQFTFVSEEAESMLGYPVSDWLNQTDFWVSMLHPDDQKDAVEYCQDRTTQGIDHAFDYRARKASGEYIWLRDIVRVNLDEDGVPTSIRGVMIDIDAQKRAEEALRESEAQRERSEEFALVMPVHVGLDGRWLKFPPRLCSFLGYSQEELLNSGCKDHTHPDDHAEDARQIERLLSGKIKSFDREKRYVRKNGQVVWAYVNCSIVTDRNGVPVHFLTYIRDIDQRVQAGQSLRESEQRHRSLVEKLPVCIHELDLSGHVISMNAAGLRMLEVSEESEVLGVPYCQVVEESDQQRVAELLREALAGTAVAFEFCGIVAGRRKMFSSNLMPVFDAESRVSKLIGVSEDITERLETEKRLRESEQLFRTIFEQAAIGVALINTRTGQFVRMNRKYGEMFGYSREELLGKTYMKISNGDSQRDLENMQKLHDGEISDFTMEKSLLRKDGSPIWINLTVSPTWNQGEEPNFHIAVVEDITERKQIEQALRNSEKSLAKAQEIARIGSWELNISTGTVVGSAETYRILGINPAENSNYQLVDAVEKYLHPDDRSTVHRAIEQAIKTGYPKPLEFRHVPPQSGKPLHLRAEAEIVIGADGCIKGLFGTLQDITWQKEAELALRESENKFRVIAENIPAMVAILQHGKIEYANDKLTSIVGYTWEDASQMNFIDLVHPDDRGLVSSRGERRLRGEDVPSRYEFKLRTKSGSVCWIDYTASLIHYRGQPAVLAIALDVTERHTTEERLRQRETELAHVSRLNTMGEMVAGIAHEINQPLSAISNFADACTIELDRIPDPTVDSIKDWTQMISQQAVRCGDIIRRLRSYAQPKKIEETSVRIADMIQDSIALLRNELRENLIDVHSAPVDPNVIIPGNPVELQQVMVNLLSNAYEAMKPCEVVERRLSVNHAVMDDVVRIDVIDNGPGIRSTNLEHLFEAFFTTRPDGLGIGLTISRSIVERHKGRLWAENMQPRGAAFHLELPRY